MLNHSVYYFRIIHWEFDGRSSRLLTNESGLDVDDVAPGHGTLTRNW